MGAAAAYTIFSSGSAVWDSFYYLVVVAVSVFSSPPL